MLKKWIVHYDAGTTGTDCYAAVLAKTAEEAEHAMQDEAIDWFYSFSGDSYETEEEENEARSEISPYAEEYDPIKHDGFLCGNASKWIFK